jgi:ABC-type lipoprotein release transport system permease subunit
VTFVALSGTVLAAAIAACGLPAWRAARVDPAATIRQE